LKREDKIVKTSSTLRNYFVIYAVLALIAFQLATAIFNNVYAKYMLEGMQSYFAKPTIDGEYPAIDENNIINAGGWVVVINQYGQIIDGGDAVSFGELSTLDVSRLTNGKFDYNDELYFASLAPFIQGENEYVVVAALPANKASATFTATNVSTSSSLSFLIAVVMRGAIFLILYSLITVILSKRLNKRIVLPIQAITQALESLKSEEYNISIDFKAKNEFVFIKNAFDLMIVRLSDAEHQRKERQKEKMKMLSDIGHDLRTPITVINGLLQALMSGRISDEKIKKEYIDTIYKNTRILLELVELQLDYTLWERKDYKMIMNQQNLSECVRDVVIANYSLCDEGGIELEVDIPEPDVFYNMDSSQLRRAFSNLMTNAIFHNTNVPNMKIGVFVWQRNNDIQVAFADTGNKLPEDVKASLIANLPLNGRANNDYGHGLGLSIMQKIIGLHGGTVQFEENWQQYSKAFIITFSSV